MFAFGGVTIFGTLQYSQGRVLLGSTDAALMLAAGCTSRESGKANTVLGRRVGSDDVTRRGADWVKCLVGVHVDVVSIHDRTCLGMFMQ